MKKEIAEKWAAALRSGDYKQRQNALSNGTRTEHCCLGVLCELAILDGLGLLVSSGELGTTYGGNAGLLPHTVKLWAGVSSDSGSFNGSNLGRENDKGVSFDGIATLIDHHQAEL